MTENNICKTCEHINSSHQHFSESGIELKEFTKCKDYINTEKCSCIKFVKMTTIQYWNFLVRKRVESLDK